MDLLKGKLTLGVNVKFASHELMKTWGLATKPVLVVWEPKTLPLGSYTGKFGETSFTVGFLPIVASSAGGMLHDYLKDVTFKEDGNIIATYNASKQGENGAETQDSWKTSNLNQAHYRVKDDVCCVYPNLEMIMRQMETGGTIDVVLLQQLLINGIPCHFELSEGTEATQDALYMYLNEEFFKQLIPFINWREP